MLLRSAKQPLAVLLLPVLLKRSAASPLAVLSSPLVLLKSASNPRPVLLMPDVRLKSASTPSAVLALPRSPSAARAAGESPKQTSTSGMRRQPRRQGERLIELLRRRVVV